MAPSELDPPELARVNAEQDGILTVAQALELAGRDALRAHLHANRWRRLCPGLLATHNGRLDHHQQLWAAVLIAGTGAALAGRTALSLAGVRGLRPGPVDVLIPALRNRSHRLPRLPPDMPPIRVRRTRCLPTEHLAAARPPRTTTARAAVDAAVWSPSAAGAKTALALPCQQGKVRPAEILEVLSVRRGVPRLSMIRATMQDIAGGAQALSEINFVDLCRRFDLPAPDLQTRRRDADGRTRYLDAHWQAYHLHVEIDGAHHMDADQWATDMLRQNQIWLEGDRILRFPAAVVRERPALVAGQLDAALYAAGWRR